MTEWLVRDVVECGRKNADCSVHFQMLLLHISRRRCGQFRFFIFPLFESVWNVRSDLDHPECRCRCYVIASLAFVVAVCVFCCRFLLLSFIFLFSLIHVDCIRLWLLDQTECVSNCILLNETQHVVDPWCGNLLVWLYFFFKWPCECASKETRRAAFKFRLTQLLFSFIFNSTVACESQCWFGILCKSIYLACVTPMIISILWMSLNAHRPIALVESTGNWRKWAKGESNEVNNWSLFVN